MVPPPVRATPPRQPAKSVVAVPTRLRKPNVSEERAGGYALSLTSGGADQRDAEFERV
jgi:hypothetical protein